MWSNNMVEYCVVSWPSERHVRLDTASVVFMNVGDEETGERRAKKGAKEEWWGSEFAEEMLLLLSLGE